jgi:hypothetical protein
VLGLRTLGRTSLSGLDIGPASGAAPSVIDG